MSLKNSIDDFSGAFCHDCYSILTSTCSFLTGVCHILRQDSCYQSQQERTGYPALADCNIRPASLREASPKLRPIIATRLIWRYDVSVNGHVQGTGFGPVTRDRSKFMNGAGDVFQAPFSGNATVRSFWYTRTHIRNAVHVCTRINLESTWPAQKKETAV